jgi:secreted trypsin-like serine protease
MHIRKLVPSLGAIAVLAGACTESRSREIAAPDGVSAIVNGTPTGDAYGNVGALLFDYDQNGISGDDEWCTGSLIAPTIFLTAAHCIVTPYTPAGSQFYVSFASDLYAKGMKAIKATDVIYDPEYGHDVSNLHDLALVFLPRLSTNGITPLSLPPAHYLDDLAAKGALSKTLFVNVGYGVSASRTGQPAYTYDGLRAFSKSEFSGITQTWLQLMMTSSTGLGGDCYGDSGGPKFIDGNTTMIVATVTTGDSNCRATTKDWRLDTPEARGFLGKYVSLP